MRTVTCVPLGRVRTERELTFWLNWLNEYTDEELLYFDRASCNDASEIAACGLTSLPRVEMARIMRALELNLYGRKTIDPGAPTSMLLSMLAEDYIELDEERPYHVTTLQCDSLMMLMGYKYTSDSPRQYNVSMRSLRHFIEKVCVMRPVPADEGWY